MALLDIIRQIHEEKVAARIVPNHALNREIQSRCPGMTARQIDLEARMLAGAGKIVTGRTLNSTYYNIVET